jgi:PIN domain nuclease of toxin-antitoxin system
MKLLLDTHAFIWWDSESSKLSSQALAFCQDRANTVLLSVASIWEMQIKLQLGKLRLNLPLAKVIESQQQTNGIEVLPIILSHVLELDSLPAYHRDPFDRLLIAQARVEDAVLISNDPIIYGLFRQVALVSP